MDPIILKWMDGITLWFHPVFLQAFGNPFVKWIALVPGKVFSGRRGREVSNFQRMSLGSFSRHMLGKHSGNAVDKLIIRSRIG